MPGNWCLVKMQVYDGKERKKKWRKGKEKGDSSVCTLLSRSLLEYQQLFTIKNYYAEKKEV